MKTGFEGIDKIININKPQLTLFTGNSLIEILTGDIANNICLHQEDNHVLEITSRRKEGLIKRLFVNESMVDYNKWTQKDKYTDEELIQIGKNTVNMIETTTKLPTIIEQDITLDLYDLDNITKLVSAFANTNADCEIVHSLIILDICPFNRICKLETDEKKEMCKFVNDIEKISKKLNVPIIMTYIIDEYLNKHDKYITKDDIDSEICKYIDNFVIANKEGDIFKIDIYDKQGMIGNCKLKYNTTYRRFEE